VLDHVGRNIFQQRTHGKPFIVNGVGISKETERDKEEEEGKDAF